MVASWLSPRHWNCFERRPTFHHPLPTCSIPGIGRRKLKPMSVAWAKKTLGPEAVVQQNWWTVYVVSLMLWLPAGWERSGVAQKSGWLGRYDCTGVFVRHVTVSNFLKVWCFGRQWIAMVFLGWAMRTSSIPAKWGPLDSNGCNLWAHFVSWRWRAKCVCESWTMDEMRRYCRSTRHPKCHMNDFGTIFWFQTLKFWDALQIVATSADLAPSDVWHRTSVTEAHRGIRLGHILGFYQSLSEGLVAWRVQASKNRHFDGSIMNNTTFIMHMYALIHFYNAICLRHSCQHLQPLPYRTNWMFLVASCMRRIPRISTNLRCHETS